VAILKVLLIIVVSIVIAALQSYSVYKWLLNTDYKEPFNPFAPFENALIGAAIAGIIFASVNSSIMYWIIF
jgi:hypothetical protein